MDSSARTGNAKPREAEQPQIEYAALISSPLLNGEVRLSVGENALSAAALFGAAEIAYAEINALKLANYTVIIEADSGLYTLTRLGNWRQPFYDALYEAYNKAVLRALFIQGAPLLSAGGAYRYTENGKQAAGSAPMRVFENCVALLPPDVGARRVPLCFVNSVEHGNYELTLRLNTGESYTFAKLGYDTAPFAEALEKQMRKLREEALAAVQELDPSLTAAQAARIAALLPQGVAAPCGHLAEIAPSFVAALEKRLGETRAHESYQAFKQLCDPAQIYVGFKKNEAAAEGAGLAAGLSAALNGQPDNMGGGNPLAALSGFWDGAQTQPPEPYIFWLVAPSPDGQFAAVEFCAADSATFVYRVNGNFCAFAERLNRALEAIGFKREIIRLTNEELIKPENAGYYMAAKRTASLQFIRANFIGRVIHSNPQSWKNRLLALWGAENAALQPVD